MVDDHRTLKDKYGQGELRNSAQVDAPPVVLRMPPSPELGSRRALGAGSAEAGLVSDIANSQSRYLKLLSRP